MQSVDDISLDEIAKQWENFLAYLEDFENAWQQSCASAPKELQEGYEAV